MLRPGKVKHGPSGLGKQLKMKAVMKSRRGEMEGERETLPAHKEQWKVEG